jgi:transcriptional regulator with XRE-family HTH domain
MPEKGSVGARIASIREGRGLARAELAERAQVDADMMDQIEQGGLVPSLAPLVRIARVLGVRLGTFLDDHESVGPIVRRAGSAGGGNLGFSGSAASSRRELSLDSLAADKAGRHMEPFIVDVDPSSRNEMEMSTHEGEEFMYVLSGSVEIAYGKDRHVLAAGDSIYYDSVVPHHVHSSGDGNARILAVVYAPF